MRRLQIQLFTLLGCALLASGIAFLSTDSQTVHAQDDERLQAEYIGTDECASCHRNVVRDHNETNHALALQDVGRRKQDILGDFGQGEEVRTVLLPGEDTARPFTEDDIEFTVGAGRYVQHYLYEIGRNDYMVLPAQWNVESQAWEPLQLAEEWPSDAYDWEQNCAYCHTTGFEVDRERWEDDGVQCEACHGPGSLHEELADDAGRNPNDEELIALRAAIYNGPDPEMCGQCHSQGVGPDDRPYPAGYIPGTDLSDLYQLVPNDSPAHWWSTGHAGQKYMQYNEWVNTTHATSLNDMRASDEAAETCLTCHSEDARWTTALIEAVESGDREGQPPEAITVASAQWGVTCTTCHNPHADSDEPFNLVQEANSLCVGCHTNTPDDSDGIHYPVKEMFEGVTLVEGIEGVAGAHFTAEDGPRCTTCHMQSLPVDSTTRATHLFKPVLPGQENGQLPNACAGCHDDLTVADLQLLIDNTQAVVHSRLDAAQAALTTTLDSVPADEAPARYGQVIAALEFVESDGSFGVHNYAYVDVLLSATERELGLLSDAAVSTEQPVEPSPTIIPADELAPPPMTAEPVTSGVRPVTILVIGAVIALLLISAVLFFRKSSEQEGQ